MPAASSPPNSLSLCVVGVVGGILAGLFGVGGGFIMVPLLMLWAGHDQRRASATSLLTIIPTAALGAAYYGFFGQVDWFASGIMAGGAILGALLGGWSLSRLSLSMLKWILIAGLLASALWVVLNTPERLSSVSYGGVEIGGLFALGLLMGVMAGLLGVGGGIIAVPTLIGLFGFGDLLAKGTSLLALIPGSIVSVALHRQRRFHRFKDVAVLVPTALAGVVVGSVFSFAIEPATAGYLLSVMLVAVAIQLSLRPPR